MKRVLFLAGIAGALVGCGSGLPTPPPLPSFNYGAPTGNLSSEQQNAAGIGEARLQTASGVNGSSDPSAAARMADDLAEQLPSSALVAVPSPDSALSSLAIPSPQASARALRGAALSVGDSSCVAKSTGSWNFNNCSYSGDGFSWTLNGSITLGTNSLKWDIRATFSANSQGVSGNGQFHWTGQLDWTQTKITGSGLSQLALKADGNGEHVELAATRGWTADLDVDPTAHCISGGSLVVAQAIEASASNGQHVSSKAGWKFTWTGCNNVAVAVGT